MTSSVACNDRRIVFCNEQLIGKAGGCPEAGGGAGASGASGAGGTAGAAAGGSGGTAGSPAGGSGGEAAGTGGTGGTSGAAGDSAIDASVPEDGGVDSGVLDATVTP
jgi:hypothetical protein